jgi:transcriptional regulator with XRE-family HTH domain
MLTIGEKITIILKRRKMTREYLAKQINQSRQNLANKLTRDNFSETEIYQIAEALNCTFETVFVFKDTGEKI